MIEPVPEQYIAKKSTDQYSTAINKILLLETHKYMLIIILLNYNNLPLVVDDDF